jgi:hypothetical protein
LQRLIPIATAKQVIAVSLELLGLSKSYLHQPDGAYRSIIIIRMMVRAAYDNNSPAGPRWNLCFHPLQLLVYLAVMLEWVLYCRCCSMPLEVLAGVGACCFGLFRLEFSQGW